MSDSSQTNQSLAQTRSRRQVRPPKRFTIDSFYDPQEEFERRREKSGCIESDDEEDEESDGSEMDSFVCDDKEVVYESESDEEAIVTEDDMEDSEECDVKFVYDSSADENDSNEENEEIDVNGTPTKRQRVEDTGDAEDAEDTEEEPVLRFGPTTGKSVFASTLGSSL